MLKKFLSFLIIDIFLLLEIVVLSKLSKVLEQSLLNLLLRLNNLLFKILFEDPAFTCLLVEDAFDDDVP